MITLPVSEVWGVGVRITRKLAVRNIITIADPLALTRASYTLLERANCGQAQYVRAGILLTDLSPAGSNVPLDLFAPVKDHANLAGLIDKVHQHCGENALGLGYAGLAQKLQWSMKRNMLSLRGTTHWAELATVKA